MKPIAVKLTDAERRALDDQWPKSKGNSAVEGRALSIVTIHFQKEIPDCSFQWPKSGADLQVFRPGAGTPLEIEVKGTASKGLARGQIKVSSAESRRLIEHGSIPIYRVSDVFGDTPCIYIMRHGEHFRLKREDRYMVVAVESRALRKPISTVSSGRGQSKYQALQRWLESQTGAMITLNLAEAPALFGLTFPASAHKYQAFWANQSDTQSRPWAKAWLDAGYRVEAFKLARDGWVRFKRVKAK